MRVKFWGVRGSIATPGQLTARYGGNTSCVELNLDNNGLIILDAGTGIRNLGEDLSERGARIQAFILITHPHWDHIHGLPFFRPAFFEGNEFTIAGPEEDGVPLDEIISQQMNKIHFPVRFSELKAKMRFLPLKQGSIEAFGAEVRAILVNHPGFTLGYRINQNGKSLVYISDNEPYSAQSVPFFDHHEKEVLRLYEDYGLYPNERIVDFARDADVLIHDSAYSPELYEKHIGWGHSDFMFPLQIAAEANVKDLFLFHYDPSFSDAAITGIVERCRGEMKRAHYSFRLHAAAEGLELQF